MTNFEHYITSLLEARYDLARNSLYVELVLDGYCPEGKGRKDPEGFRSAKIEVPGCEENCMKCLRNWMDKEYAPSEKL